MPTLSERLETRDALFPTPVGEWSPLTAAYRSAAPWVNPDLTTTAFRARAAPSFWQAALFPHLQIKHPLLPSAADAIFASLTTATFKPHHHAGHPTSVAPRDLQPTSPLTDFMDWLATSAASMFHRWLVSYAFPLRATKRIQVQAMQMTLGEHFPPHIDSASAECLVAIYQFTRPGTQCGGDLCFPDTLGRDRVIVPPRFNSLFLFRSKGTVHRVSHVTTNEGRLFSVSAFYMAG